MYSINAQGYFNRDPERDAFYLISYQTCRRINVTWPSPYPEVKAFVKEATRVVYDQDKICWNGAPLSSVKSFHRDTACWVSLIFDHHLTTAVQMPCEMPEKPVVTTNNGLFSRFGLNCAEPINFTFQRWSMPPCRSSPTRKARGSNPPGRTRKSPCNALCKVIFCLLYFRFKSASAAYHLSRLCTALLIAVRSSVDLWWFA